MRAVAEGGATSAGPMREAALGEGAMLHHLAIAAAGKVLLHLLALLKPSGGMLGLECQVWSVSACVSGCVERGGRGGGGGAGEVKI